MYFSALFTFYLLPLKNGEVQQVMLEDQEMLVGNVVNASNKTDASPDIFCLKVFITKFYIKYLESVKDNLT